MSGAVEVGPMVPFNVDDSRLGFEDRGMRVKE